MPRHAMRSRPFLLVAAVATLLALGATDALANDGRAPTYVTRSTVKNPRVPSPRIAAGPTRVDTTRRTSRVVRMAEPKTAAQLAAMQGLSYKDAQTYVLLEGATLRIRLYPGTNVVVIAAREYQVKDRIVRNRADVQLTPRVARFLQTRIYEYRQRESQRRVVVKPRPRLEPLPPLPERRPIARKVPKVDVKPASRPAPKRPSVAAPRAGRDWAPRVNERDWKWVVLHHSDDLSGDMAKYDDYHRNDKGWENGCGYHFVIGNGSLSGDGEVEVGPRWPVQLQGAHCKVPGNRYNERGVGICLVGDFEEGSARPSRAQMDALVNLVRWLKQRYRIDDADIIGHCDACSTCCPGRNFPWAEFRRRISE